ncbi:MAG: hypothetical protein LC796_12820 [Acidobacteria bacterium]|nr:hypothetical protein [Acidobacteriota bacterium]MCA1611568.1 hypothetical protein [Acidobacteriota bacterium]
MTGGHPLELEEARHKLRDLGYLDGRVERYVFSRVFEGRRGILAPVAVALAAACAVGCVAAVLSAEPEFLRSGSGPLVLLLHLSAAFFLPAALAAAAGAAVADRSRAAGPGAAACGLLAAAAVFLLWIGGAWSLGRALRGSALLWGFPVAVAALGAARSARAAYLARAYAHSGVLPRARRHGTLFGIAAAGLVIAAAVFASRPEGVVSPRLHVAPRRERVVVVAIDGVAGGAAGAVGEPALAGLLEGAPAGWWRQEPGAPPELWTTVATGVDAVRHGVRALERVRPAGSPAALRAPVGSRWYLRVVGPALSLVSSAPVSAADRRALAFWEVAASAGLPSGAIGWWASGPWPGAVVVDNRHVLSLARTGEEADAVALERWPALRGAAIAALYLPGPDILRRDPARRGAELERIGRFLAAEIRIARAGESVLVVLTADSHASAGSLARATVFDGRSSALVRIEAADVASSVLARAGIPAAEDLRGRAVPALFREGSLEKATVATYGARIAPAAGSSVTTDREYLRRLKALGYLN